MIVPEAVRKCVAFLALQRADGEFQLAGSVFWVGKAKEGEDKADTVYAVTARHVIDRIRSKGVEDVFVRLNHRNAGLHWGTSKVSDWYVHPSDPSLDVAILRTGMHPDSDHLALPYSIRVTDEVMRDNAVGLGEEVFITGLFRHHHGSQRNIPIVRVGNLACMGEECIATRDFPPMDALLIEARSIGGLSGSPVFLNLGVSRMIKGKTMRTSATPGQPMVYLLGLIHGHYDVDSTDIDHSDSVLSTQQVNTGIAIVVPFHSIQAVIDTYEADGA